MPAGSAPDWGHQTSDRVLRRSEKRNHLSWTLHKDELWRWENVYWYWKVAHQVIPDEKVQHYLKRKGRKKTFTKLEVAVINNDDRNCQWKIGVVEYHILWKKKMVLKSFQSASRKDNTPKELSRNSILLNWHATERLTMFQHHCTQMLHCSGRGEKVKRQHIWRSKTVNQETYWTSTQTSIDVRHLLKKEQRF